MATFGFNLQKGELYLCSMDGTKAVPRYVVHGHLDMPNIGSERDAVRQPVAILKSE